MYNHEHGGANIHVSSSYMCISQEHSSFEVGSDLASTLKCLKAAGRKQDRGDLELMNLTGGKREEEQGNTGGFKGVKDYGHDESSL